MKITKWVGLLVIRNKKVLMVREKDKDYFAIPGGSVEKGEDDEVTLQRELLEELGITSVDKNKHQTFKLPGKTEGYEIQFVLYKGEIAGKINLGPEIAEYAWLDSNHEKENKRVGSITSLKLFPQLKAQSLIA